MFLSFELFAIYVYKLYSYFLSGTVLIDNEEHAINEENGLATAKAVNFFNDLFDSTNSSEKVKDDDNELRRPILDDSVHHAFWVSA